MILKYGNNTLNYNNRVLNLTNIITSGLTVWLDASISSSYPGTGNNWYDISGNSNHGVMTGITFDSASGGSMVFAGVNQAVSIRDSVLIKPSTTQYLTLQAWVNPSTLKNAPFIGKLSSNYAFDGYHMSYTSGGGLNFVTNGTAINRANVSGTSVITASTWQLVTYSFVINNTTGSSKGYVNTTQIISSVHGTDGYSEFNPLYIGYIGTGVASNYFDGKIGAVYIYNRELSLSEIIQNYNNTKSRFGL